MTGYRQSSSSSSSSLSLSLLSPLRTLVAFLAVVPPLLPAVERWTAQLAQPHPWIFFFPWQRELLKKISSLQSRLFRIFLFWCSFFSWFLFQNPKTGGGKNAWLVTMALAFAVPEVAENLEGWGPGPASVPSQLEHVPYAPFSKADRVGRASDWTAQAFKYASGTSAFLFLFPFSSCRMSERTRGL